MRSLAISLVLFAVACAPAEYVVARPTFNHAEAMMSQPGLRVAVPAVRVEDKAHVNLDSRLLWNGKLGDDGALVHVRGRRHPLLWVGIAVASLGAALIVIGASLYGPESQAEASCRANNQNFLPGLCGFDLLWSEALLGAGAVEVVAGSLMLIPASSMRSGEVGPARSGYFYLNETEPPPLPSVGVRF